MFLLMIVVLLFFFIWKIHTKYNNKTNVFLSPCRNLKNAWWEKPDDVKTSEIAGNNRDIMLNLNIQDCNMSIFSLLYFEECLKNKHIVFMGDSLTRYQYLSLVHYLETGSWFALTDKPLLENEKEWENWEMFYQGTNARLNGHEICGCYRHPYGWIIDANPMEDRYYFDPVRKLRITFLLFFGSFKTVHPSPQFLNVGCSTSTPEELCLQKGCSPGLCNFKLFNFSENWPYNMLSNVIKNVATTVAPIDALIFNQGFFGNPGDNLTHSMGIVRAFKESRENGYVSHIYWKSTTNPNPKGSFKYNITIEHLWVKSFLIPLKINVFDVYELTTEESFIFSSAAEMNTESTWDFLHFKPFAYRGFNKALAGELCESGGPFYLDNNLR